MFSSAQNSDGTYPVRIRAGGFTVWSLKEKYASERYLVDYYIRTQKEARTRQAREYQNEQVERVKAKINRPLSAYGPRRVQNSPSLGYAGNGESDSYEGPTPKRRRGKGRSVSVGRVIDPSLELQTGARAEDRIGSLTGSSRAPRQSTATMFSRFGANKDYGPGLMGASASRARGGKNMLAHPETWMKRFLPAWIASEYTKGLQNWQGWDKVSFSMDSNEARNAMGPSKHLGALAPKAVGMVAKGSIFLGKITAPLSASVFAPLFGKSQSDAARAMDMLDQYGNWIALGGKASGTDTPLAAMEKYDKSVLNHIGNVQRAATQKAQLKFDKELQDGVAGFKDTLALRGAGGVNKVLGALRRSPEMVKTRQEIGRAASNNVDVNEEIKWLKNRFFGHLK